MKNPNFTKRGPGRRHQQGDGNLESLSLKQRLAGQFSRTLREWITLRNREALGLFR